MDCSQSQTIIYAQLHSYAALHSLIMIPSPIIETRQISRDFKKKRAVNALDLSIQPGELFGIVGPDGAGKTTILRLLAGLLTITDGSGIINGFDLAKQSESIKAQIGYMAQSFSLYSKLSVLENLNFFALNRILFQYIPNATFI